jgi:hypothetical protein
MLGIPGDERRNRLAGSRNPSPNVIAVAAQADKCPAPGLGGGGAREGSGLTPAAFRRKITLATSLGHRLGDRACAHVSVGAVHLASLYAYRRSVSGAYGASTANGTRPAESRLARPLRRRGNRVSRPKQAPTPVPAQARIGHRHRASRLDRAAVGMSVRRARPCPCDARPPRVDGRRRRASKSGRHSTAEVRASS